MAELIAKLSDTFLLRRRVQVIAKCDNEHCTRDEQGPVYAYWFSEDQGSMPVSPVLAFCSSDCFFACQSGPRPLNRPRRYGERFPPGHYPATASPAPQPD